MRSAEQIIGQLTGGTTRTRDVPGAPPGTHNLDVVLPDGHVLAVEATLHTDRGQLGLHAAIRQYSEWIYPELACSWYLILDPEATQVRSLHAEAGTLLASHPGEGYCVWSSAAGYGRHAVITHLTAGHSN